jgi:CheY-like chemotaxis protein/MinD-like ATPase involved in chromosome partitioning or flagellar assembly
MTVGSKIGSQKILVVDDDLDTLKLVGTTLEKQGFLIVAAKDGLEALEKVAQHNPDLILLDIMMPKMDGYEVTRRLRGDPATSGIPIILFTAKAQVDDKVAGLEVGADDYLTKPTHPAELVARVRSILKRPVTSMLPPLPEEPGRTDGGAVIGILAAKGGQGVSTLAINLGAALQNQHKDPSVAIAELRPGRGDLAIYLGFPDKHGLIDILKRAPGDIHRQIVEQALVTHKSGLKVMLASYKPSDVALETAVEQMALVVRELARIATHVVLDLGVGLPPATLRALQQCSKVIVVAEADPHSVPLTKALIEDLKAKGITKEKLLAVLVNRVRTDQAMSAADVQKSLGVEIDAVFTPAPELAYQAARTNQSMLSVDPQSFTAQQAAKVASLITEPK